jgi:hypothetical protein
LHRHCERSEAIQSLSAEGFWIASSQELLAMTNAEAGGLQALALPVGQNTQTVGQRPPLKIFHFTEVRKRRMYRGNPAQGRGAYRDRHERGPGGGGR